MGSHGQCCSAQHLPGVRAVPIPAASSVQPEEGLAHFQLLLLKETTYRWYLFTNYPIWDAVTFKAVKCFHRLLMDEEALQWCYSSF